MAKTEKKAKTAKDDAEVLSIDGREVRISHPGKLYFSRQVRLTKADLVRYYLAVAPGALAGIQDRPIVQKRFVNGAEAEPYYLKRAPDPRPEWLRTVTLSFPSGRTAEEVVGDDAAGLAWVVNLGCIELHPHPVRSADLDHPDQLRVDLDPGPGVAWADVRRAALAVGREIERRAPGLATAKWWKEERHGVFIDYNQNAKDRTTSSAYSVRPLPDARVSAPLTRELVPDCDPAAFTVATMPARFVEIGDRHRAIN